MALSRSAAVASSLLFVVSTAAGVATCDKSPLTPVPVPTPTPTVARPASVPAVTGVRAIGPSSVAPGATAQFTAIADFSDGTSRDVTAEATWRSQSQFPALVLHESRPRAGRGSRRSLGHGDKWRQNQRATDRLRPRTRHVPPARDDPRSVRAHPARGAGRDHFWHRHRSASEERPQRALRDLWSIRRR